MVDVYGALHFLQQHGSPLHHTLGQYVVGEAAAPDVVAALLPYQRADGGWGALNPDCPTTISTMHCTWRALQYARWMSADNHPLVDRTAQFLAAAQHPDGYWDEPDAVRTYDVPSWLVPGQRSVRVWLTAALTRMLTETGHETHVYFGKALNYLSAAWHAGLFHTPDAPVNALWMMLPLFKAAGQPEDAPIIEGCHDLLLERVQSGLLDPMDVTMVAHAALNARYTGNRLYVAARDKALGHQLADGGWATYYGEAHRPNATVDALMLLRWAGLL